jgi:hypothetical protein
VSAERDYTGDLLVSVIARSSGTKGAIEATESALALATESMGPVAVKGEYVGIIEDEMDQTRLASLPSGPPVGWLRRRARGQSMLSEIPALWFEVEARITEVSPTTATRPLAADLLSNMRAMGRIELPSVTVDAISTAVVLTFDIAGSDIEEAHAAALSTIETLVSASINERETACRIDIARVSLR